MPSRLIPYLLTCGPIVLTLSAWISVCWWRRPWPNPVTLAALVIVSANAAFAAGTFVWFEFRPSPFLPPWEDPKTLQLAMLFLFAPVGMIVSFVAALRGAPKWLIILLEVASLPLLVVGILESVSV